MSIIGGVFAADKVRLGTALKLSPSYTLVVLAGEEKGFWKQNRLEMEWLPFRGGSALQRGVAAASVDVAMSDINSLVLAVARGVPTMVVADMGTANDFAVVVRSDLPINKPADLKGARLGILRARGASHSYGRLVARALNLEGKMKFIAGGGIREEVAALKSGVLDGRITSISPVLSLVVNKEVKVVLYVRDYHPKEWLTRVVSARTELVNNKPELVKGAVRSLLQSADYLMKNPEWTIEKIKATFKYSDVVAKATLPFLQFSRDGKVDRRALENNLKFLLDYKVLAKDKVPPIDKLFTNKFTN